MSQGSENSNTTTLGARIRNARKSAGMTIAHLAEIMSVSVAAVQQWEADKTTPTVDRLLKLTELLGGGILVNPSRAWLAASYNPLPHREFLLRPVEGEVTNRGQSNLERG
jgi:transcriptional regulator with XRE-family HTH domain